MASANLSLSVPVILGAASACILGAAAAWYWAGQRNQVEAPQKTVVLLAPQNQPAQKAETKPEPVPAQEPAPEPQNPVPPIWEESEGLKALSAKYGLSDPS